MNKITLFFIILVAGCAGESRVTLNVSDPNWESDSILLEDVFNFIEHTTGKTYELDERIQELRILIPDISIYSPDRLREIILTEYYLKLQETPDGMIKVMPEKEIVYYDQYRFDKNGMDFLR